MLTLLFIILISIYYKDYNIQIQLNKFFNKKKGIFQSSSYDVSSSSKYIINLELLLLANFYFLNFR